MLSVLMPVFNERRTVEEAIHAVLATDVGMEKQLVVVDDGSTDGTRELLRNGSWPDEVRILFHDRNRGKGAAVRTALPEARGEFAAILDADLEYEPADLATLVQPLEEGLSNAVFGVRAFDGYTSHSFLYVLGNRAVTLVANVLFNVYLRDLMTCQKVIRTDLFRSLELTESGFTIEPEITARLIQSGERIFELPVRYHARGHAEGKKLTGVDGLRVIGTLIRCRMAGGRGAG